MISFKDDQYRESKTNFLLKFVHCNFFNYLMVGMA